jgi:RNA polymerase sigma-70 factor (ECF subfamily)
LRRRSGSEQDAQDLLQETYIRMVRFGYGEPPRPVPVWRALLYRTATSLAANLGREQRQHHAGAHDSIDDVELVSEQSSPEQQVEQAQELEVMVAVLRALPPRCRQVFILHRLRGRSYAQIAQECEISIKAVEKHISRALSAFRGRVGLGRQDVSS